MFHLDSIFANILPHLFYHLFSLCLSLPPPSTLPSSPSHVGVCALSSHLFMVQLPAS